MAGGMIWVNNAVFLSAGVVSMRVFFDSVKVS